MVGRGAGTVLMDHFNNLFTKYIFLLIQFIILFPANNVLHSTKNNQNPTGWGAGQPGFPCL